MIQISPCGGWTVPPAPHSCSHILKRDTGLHRGWRGSHVSGVTVLTAEKRPLLEQTPAGISQLAAPQPLCAGQEGKPNPNPEGEDQWEPVRCVSLTGQDHSHHINSGRSPGLGLQQGAHPIHQSISSSEQAGYGYD